MVAVAAKTEMMDFGRFQSRSFRQRVVPLRYPHHLRLTCPPRHCLTPGYLTPRFSTTSCPALGSFVGMSYFFTVHFDLLTRRFQSLRDLEFLRAASAMTKVQIALSSSALTYHAAGSPWPPDSCT